MLKRDTPVGILIIPFIIMGIGMGSVFQTTLVAVQAHSPKSRRAVIISSRNFYRCAGGACGLAISAAILQARLRAALPPQYAYLADSTYSVPDFGGAPIPSEVLDAYMSASRAVFILQIPLIGACVLSMFFVKDRGLEPFDDTVQEGPLAPMEESGGITPSGGLPQDGPSIEEGRVDSGVRCHSLETPIHPPPKEKASSAKTV